MEGYQNRSNPGYWAQQWPGITIAKIIKGSNKPQILLSTGDGIYCIQIPDKNPEKGNWLTTRIAPMATEEGIGVGDVNGDGNPDIATGYIPKGGIDIKMLNPISDGGRIQGTVRVIGNFIKLVKQNIPVTESG